MFLFPYVIPFLTPFVSDQYLRVEVSCGQSSAYKIFQRILCNWSGCCRLRTTWVQTPEWSCRPPERRTVSISNAVIMSLISLSSVRYANMDFALLSTLLPSIAQGITRVLVSYDIGCQWDKKLQARISQYSTSATFKLSSLDYWKVVVPKFHLSGHGQNCQLRYNINFTKGAAHMCGEGIESGWSQSGSMAIWTRENGVRIAIDHVTWDAYTRHFKARAYIGCGWR